MRPIADSQPIFSPSQFFQMKTTIFSALTIIFSAFVLNANAQTATKSNDEAVVLKFWNEVFAAYDKGDEATMWAAYDENACEIYPDGSHMCGLAALKAGYEQFKGMLEGTPSWKSGAPEIHFIDPNNALLISEVTSDLKLKGGQQIGGKMKFTALVHKANGKWKIVYDSQTPVMQMPGN